MTQRQMSASWLSERRKQFVEHLLTLGPILGIVLAFIGNSVQRVFLAEDLVVFVISSTTVYALLVLEFPIDQGFGMVFYSFGCLGIASGFGYLVGLVASFYGTLALQAGLTIAVFLLVSFVLVLPFRIPARLLPKKGSGENPT